MVLYQYRDFVIDIVMQVDRKPLHPITTRRVFFHFVPILLTISINRPTTTILPNNEVFSCYRSLGSPCFLCRSPPSLMPTSTASRRFTKPNPSRMILSRLLLFPTASWKWMNSLTFGSFLTFPRLKRGALLLPKERRSLAI